MEIRDTVCAALRGENPAWHLGHDAETEVEFAKFIRFHGVQGLLHQADLSGWPQVMRDMVRREALSFAAWELQHRHVLNQIFRELGNEGVIPLVLKGSALAVTHYSRPSLRVRGDTDVLVAIGRRTQVEETLTKIGFSPGLSVNGDYVVSEQTYTKTALGGSSHTVDLHWRVNNSLFLSALFSYEELTVNAQPLDMFNGLALGCSSVDSLLFACLHRAVHRTSPYTSDGQVYQDPNRLIWLYDIHLLAGILKADEWAIFLESATRKELRSVCLDAFLNTLAAFGTRIPFEVMKSLSAPSRERPARYFSSSNLVQHVMDLQALHTYNARWKLLKEWFFPGRSYMQRRFPQLAVLPLPFLYAWRLIRRIKRTRNFETA